MRIPRLFIDAALAIDDEKILAEHSSHYLNNVLRLKSGNHIRLFNGLDDCEYDAEITITGKKIVARITNQQKTEKESFLQTCLIQAIGKVEHIDFTVQKTTELGISKIVLFNSERTQTPLKGQRLLKKLEHWHRVAISACEQCGRNCIPSIEFFDRLDQAFEHCPQSNRVILDINGKKLNEQVWDYKNTETFIMLTGPEGGLNQQEIDLALANQFKPVRLGPRIMRMETASVALLSILQQQYGDFN